jgi:tRNA G10  N-methylase Trm11
MSYLAILGRQPILSLAELEMVLGAGAVKPQGHQAILTTEPNLIRLGGTVKIARVIAQGRSLDAPLLDQVANQLNQSSGSTKLSLGISLYDKNRRTRAHAVGMELKRRLKGARPIRLILPKSPATELAVAQLKFNQAEEVIFMVRKGRVLVGLTTQYQDIDAYSQRDYGRPERDSKVGMLPPKLAQILINLAGLPAGTIYDPFCGTGVILQEARLMGFRAIGSDINPQMVTAAKANQAWLSKQSPNLPAWEVVLADARRLRIDEPQAAIVSENYLGPVFSTQPSQAQLKLADVQVSETTESFLTQLSQTMPSNFPVVLCLPQWQTAQGPKLPTVIDEIPRLGYTFTQFAHVDGRELTYMRPGQLVGRKILVMRRK